MAYHRFRRYRTRFGRRFGSTASRLRGALRKMRRMKAVLRRLPSRRRWVRRYRR